MFDTVCSSGLLRDWPEDAPLDAVLDRGEDCPEDCPDLPPLEEVAVETAEERAARQWRGREEWLRFGVERTYGNTEPSALLGMELDVDADSPGSLSDAELIDAVVGFDRVAAWAQARRTEVLAEFARRRPGDDNTMVAVDKPCGLGRFAPDEVGLALRKSRMTAKAELGRAVQLTQVLPEALAVWKAGRLDERRVAAICDGVHYLPVDKARAVQARVLDRAPEQTLAQVKAAVKRAVAQVDPEGVFARHRAAHRERRVVLNPEEEGMASLWASMSAADALACSGR
ncbi:DUF222 domain-containing protein [Pseudonocardia kunmingensis]|uniref:Uncharacterized protein DUF222 n=1 Tax=Pseudonocardia kunmingensis TaxID=630975 RepID=A0A543DZK3_9PSEU|nr:DUF222 domain-containing protein [Pseudonocardia kunmingensis]TQM14766.1 uncharacterized protein DUF222 [Pseudonocardia kunmingensis]